MEVKDKFERLLRNGNIVYYPSDSFYRTWRQGNINLEIKYCPSLAKKQKSIEPNERRDPFLPPEASLVLSDIGNGHTLLFNKFCVVPHHLLIISKNFIAQESLLELVDFEACSSCLGQLASDDWLFFYNSGPESGASQAHRHIQLIPGTDPPIIKGVQDGNLVAFEGRLYYFEPLSPGESAWYEAYQRALQVIPVGCNSYNLCFTTRWLLLVPRRLERVQGISLNALAIVGYLLVNSPQEVNLLKGTLDLNSIVDQGSVLWENAAEEGILGYVRPGMDDYPLLTLAPDVKGMISYEGKMVLAPMVRVGTLPMRLLALEYGADLIWSPEMVDKKLIGSKRITNESLDTIDYVKEQTLVFRTHASERSRLVLQLGSADAELALEAAKLVANDVAGIDLNCGCPKHFSVHAGMGAALLTNPSRLTAILRRLVTGLPQLPITAKIRLLPSKEETLSLVKNIAETGIRALTVHCRTMAERPRHAAHHEWLPEIIKLCPFPVIVNGDIFSNEDVTRMKALGVNSFMVARAAQWNVSVFRREGLLDPHEVSAAYLRKAITVDNPFSNTKYTLMQMWIDRPYSDHRFTASLQQAKTYPDLCAIFNVAESTAISAEPATEAYLEELIV